LPEVDLVICHGGNGTLYHALKNKVPVLCLEAHLEQTWNIHRMEELGYGQALDNRNPANIHHVVLEWLEKKSTISWDLNFEAFSQDIQDQLLLKITSENC
jgi:UDP:flavonoid glycosyltransferase YjiC (YdhE family)